MKAFLRATLRQFCLAFPVRGRHRLADKVGKWLAPAAPEVLTINKVPITLDHELAFCRYMYYGVYEEPNLKFLAQVVRPGDVVMDPGANIGYITAHLAGMVGETGKVFSLEPSPNCLHLLEPSIQAARLPQLNLLPYALADKPATLTFNDTPRAISSGYATLDVVNRPKDSHAVEVQATSVDALCAREGIAHLRFLKLDIEGAELLALEGSRGMLARKAIDYILIETTMQAQVVDRNQGIIDLLQGYGYAPYLISPRGKLRPVTLDIHGDMRADVIWTHIPPAQG